MTFKPITHDPLITMLIIGILEDWVLSGQKNAVQVYILHHVFELAELNLDLKICLNGSNIDNFVIFNT